MLINLAGVVQGAAEVRAMAPMVAVLTFGERLAIFNIMVISTIPYAKEGVVVGAIGLEVIKVVVGVVDLVIGHMSKRRCAVDDPGGNIVVGVGI